MKDDDLFATEDEDNWLVSYADLLTNLLAFFVMLFAISNVTNTRWEMLTNALQGKKRAGSITEMKQKLDAFIKENALAEDLETSIDDQGLQVRFRTKLLFESAHAELTSGAGRVLEPFAQALQAVDVRYDVVVEGHADDIPIHTQEFASNWELSAKRSVNVVKRLIELGVPKQQISAQAFAETRPEAGDDRAANRRVVVRVR
jgi:chemotaxis protein MotB